MTDTVKSWIEERRAIHTAATEGPWEHGVKPFRGDIGHNVSSPERVVMFGGFESASPTAEADSVAVVDAHNIFPRALNALEAVIELHKPLGYIGRDGETVWDECEHCHGSGWPCETVEAIE